MYLYDCALFLIVILLVLVVEMIFVCVACLDICNIMEGQKFFYHAGFITLSLPQTSVGDGTVMKSLIRLLSGRRK